MEHIALATTGRTTTRLGFGCSSIMGGLSRRESLAMLEAAVDAGITHFDVAPSYGYGQAEGCLGEVCRRHPGRLTVTTKFGIPGAKNQSLLSVARSVAGPLIRKVPGLKKRVAGVAANVVRREAQPSFTPEAARLVLEHSLAELKTGSIDVWLLHEVTAADLQDDRLLDFLRESVTQGKIGSFGVGSGREKIPVLWSQRPEYCPVTQYEWSVLDPVIEGGPSFRMHHRALTDGFRTLHAGLATDAGRRARWSQATGQDLADAGVLAKLMLKASLVANPGSVILFSSKKPGHIAANVETAGDASLEAPSRRLHDLVQQDYAGLNLKAVS